MYITLQKSAVDKIKFTMIRLSYFIGKTMSNTF